MSAFRIAVCLLTALWGPFLGAEPSYDLGASILKYMAGVPMPKNGGIANHDAVSASYIFDGCPFRSFEYPACTNPQCKSRRVSDPIYDNPYHNETRCTLTGKGAPLVQRNLDRETKVHVTMHGAKCCVTTLSFDSKIPANFSQILDDKRFAWAAILCPEKRLVGEDARWYRVSAPHRHSIVARIETSEGSGGTWESLDLFWDTPEKMPRVGELIHPTYPPSGAWTASNCKLRR
jgi:hypothetical protein